MNPDIELASRFVQVNGVRLHYLEWPESGQPLIFVHGTSHCGGVWAPLAARLSDAFHVLALDIRGHGLSEKPSSGYDWASLRDDLVGLLEALDLKEVFLVGHSRGGGVSILAATACPQRVRGLILYEPTVVSGEGLPWRDPRHVGSGHRLAHRAVRRRSVFMSRQEIYDRYRPRGVFKTWREEFVRAYVEHGAGEREDGRVELLCPPWVEAQLYQEMARSEAWGGIRNAQLPVLACYGDAHGHGHASHDPAERLRRVLPRCEVRVMSGATHFGPMEQPEVFEGLVREFADTLG